VCSVSISHSQLSLFIIQCQSEYLFREEYEFAFEVEKGYQESVFLKHFVKSLDELEVKADNCTKVCPSCFPYYL